jgi:hypothetical protein
VHITCVVLTLASLAMTMRYAYRSASSTTCRRRLDHAVHLTLAQRRDRRASVLPVASGVRTIYRPPHAPAAPLAALGVLALTVLTACDGRDHVMVLAAARAGARACSSRITRRVLISIRHREQARALAHSGTSVTTIQASLARGRSRCATSSRQRERSSRSQHDARSEGA